MYKQTTFIQLMRSKDTMELIKEQDAFILLSIIALRARRTNEFNVHELKQGEALIGDFKNYGMTEQRYRTAKKKLEKWKFITIKATTKGTIATLLDNGIYDINLEANNGQSNGQATDDQRTTNDQPTTNNNDKNVNKENNGKELVIFDEARKLYRGKKRGLIPEWKNFKKKYGSWKTILPLLKPAIEEQNTWHPKDYEYWKNFQTWINNECWTEENATIEKGGKKQATCYYGKHHKGHMVRKSVPGLTCLVDICENCIRAGKGR